MQDQSKTTSISTLQANKIAPDVQHAHTHIRTYMKKREKGDNTTTTNLTVYNKDNYQKLQEIALRNNTNVSSILSNFIDSFANHFDEKPQTLDSFLDPDFVPCPILLDSDEKIINFVKKQDQTTLETLDSVLFRAHVYARILSANPQKRKMIEGMDYVSLWRNYYK